MRHFEDKYNRVRKQSQYLAWFAIGSFVMALMNTANVLWVIPLAASYLGMSCANSDCRRLEKQIQTKFGSDAEEYY